MTVQYVPASIAQRVRGMILPGSTDFTREEWTLKQERGKISTSILIYKASWVFHCERCNVDHNRKKRINQAVILKRTQRRIEVVIATYGDINDTQEA